MSAPLRIDEWVLHYLMGVPALDDRIALLLETIPLPSILPASHQAETLRLAALWADSRGSAPVALLRGNASADKRAVAAAAAAACQSACACSMQRAFPRRRPSAKS